ncbi:MAG TPA: SHOCT domain-containing protein [Candidatus Paceibacterota bacterium]|nr:SHOCT domain-containing protein [Candidatus Paceibacterota bacterium]
MYVGYGLGFGALAVIFNILWWILIITLIVTIVRWIRDGHPNRGERKAIDILKERYAKGEIDKQEFEAKKKDLIS